MENDPGIVRVRTRDFRLGRLMQGMIKFGGPFGVFRFQVPAQRTKRQVRKIAVQRDFDLLVQRGCVRGMGHDKMGCGSSDFLKKMIGIIDGFGDQMTGLLDLAHDSATRLEVLGKKQDFHG